MESCIECSRTIISTCICKYNWFSCIVLCHIRNDEMSPNKKFPWIVEFNMWSDFINFWLKWKLRFVKKVKNKRQTPFVMLHFYIPQAKIGLKTFKFSTSSVRNV
jgi:hypothetical protein